MVFKAMVTPCKMATWWLTKEEYNDAAFMDSLKPSIHLYQRKGYMTATCVSGLRDLEASTYQLMKRNYEQLSLTKSLAPNNGCEAFSICCKCWNNLIRATLILSVASGVLMCYNVAIKKQERSEQH